MSVTLNQSSNPELCLLWHSAVTQRETLIQLSQLLLLFCSPHLRPDLNAIDVLMGVVKNHSWKWRKMSTEVEVEEMNTPSLTYTLYLLNRLCNQWWIFHQIHTVLCVFPVVSRYELLQKKLLQLEEAEGGFDQFTRSYKTFGVQRQPDNSLFFKEWAPAAEALFLTGDFSK